MAITSAVGRKEKEGKVREVMIARLLFAVLWMSLATSVSAQPVQLITDKEARLPAAPQAPSRAITRGPTVKLLSPESVANVAFPLKVVFEPRGGSKIDLGSVQVTYLKNPPVDLTVVSNRRFVPTESMSHRRQRQAVITRSALASGMTKAGRVPSSSTCRSSS